MTTCVTLVVYDFESKIYTLLIMNTYHSQSSSRLWELMKNGTISLCNSTDVEKWCQNLRHLMAWFRKRTDPPILSALVAPTLTSRNDTLWIHQENLIF